VQQPESQAQSTSVLTFPPDDDPVQFVRRQYLAVLGVEPDPPSHYDWANRLLLCGTDQQCVAQGKTDLNTFLNTPAAPSALGQRGKTLTWRDNSANEDGFQAEIFDPDTSAWTPYATTGPNVTKVGVNTKTARRYRVRAFNAFGFSAYSNEATAGGPTYAALSMTTGGAVSGDDFNDATLSSGWTLYRPQAANPTVGVQSGQLQIAPAPNTAGYNGVYTTQTYDLTGRMTQVEVVQPVSQAGWCENFFRVWLDANNYYHIGVGGWSISFVARVGGVNDTTTIGYDPAATRFWRIRHDQYRNTVNFETSADDVTWTVQKTVASAFPLASTRVFLMAGAWGTGNGNPGAAVYDNFELVTGTTGADSRLPNFGFEAPAVGYSAFQYNPTGGVWSFAGSSGVTGNGSGFTGGLAAAPEGAQAAFLQGGSYSTISQAVSGFQADKTYIVTFAAAQRSNCCNAGGQDFRVYLDGALLGTFRPAGAGYAYYSTPTFTATAGTHTLSFVGLNSLGGDHSAFIDNVRVTASTGW